MLTPGSKCDKISLKCYNIYRYCDITYCQAQFQQAIAAAFELRQPYNHYETDLTPRDPTPPDPEQLTDGVLGWFFVTLQGT